jgi:hypothetical protein
MAETAIVPVITALAPYVLDSLFGEGYDPQHIPKHVSDEVIGDHRNISIFSPPSIKDKMSLYGYGYRYPRAKRKVIELEYPEDYLKAAVFNKGVAANNNWVQFLKFNGYYDKIRTLLQEASQKYRQSGLAKQYSAEDVEEMKEAKKRKLLAQVEAIKKYAQTLKPKYPTKYDAGLTFDEALYELMYKIDNELEKLGEARQFTKKDQVFQRRPPAWLKK